MVHTSSLRFAVLVSFVAFIEAVRLPSPSTPCEANPCAQPAMTTGNFTCCPTYPCANTSDIRPIIELAYPNAFGFNAMAMATLAVDSVIADPTLLPGYQFRIRWHSTYAQPALALRALNCTTASSIVAPATTMAIVGMYYDADSPPIGLMGNYLGLPVLSQGSTSAAMYDTVTYGTFNRLAAGSPYLAQTMLAVLQNFNWKRVTVLYTSSASPRTSSNPAPTAEYLAQMQTFIAKASLYNVTIAAALEYNWPNTNATEFVGKMASTEAHIFVCFLFNIDGREVMQEARSIGSEDYVWIFTNDIISMFTNNGDPVNRPLKPARSYFLPTNILTSAAIPLQNTVFDALKVKWARVRSGLDPTKINGTNGSLLYFDPSVSNFPQVYDSIRFPAQVMNAMANNGIALTPANLLTAMRANTTSFQGASGQVQLSSTGDRALPFTCFKFNETIWDFSPTWIVDLAGAVSLISNVSTPTWGATRGTSKLPVSIPTRVDMQVKASLTSFILCITLASLIFLMAMGFLTFNLMHRLNTMVRMTSPMLNCVIILGNVLALLSIPVEVMSGGETSVVCTVRPWLLCIGFTLAFGSLAAKTWRIMRIFDLKGSSVRIPTWYLLVGVAGMLVVDAILLGLLTGLDPVLGQQIPLPVYQDPVDPDRVVAPFVLICASTGSTGVWLMRAIYLYKGIIIAAAAVLAFRTMHVEIAALNDAKQIGVAIYTTGLITGLVAGIVGFISVDAPGARFVLVSVAVCLSAAAPLIILFGPMIHAVRTGTDKAMSSLVPKQSAHPTRAHTMRAPSQDKTAQVP